MSNKKYTNDFKKKVIKEYVLGNESFYSLERKYNISNSSIKNWYYNFYKKGIDLSTIKDNCGRKKEMARKGTPLDDAPIESWHALLKKETLYNNNITSLQECQRLVEEWILFYNSKRLKSKKKSK